MFSRKRKIKKKSKSDNKKIDIILCNKNIVTSDRLIQILKNSNTKSNGFTVDNLFITQFGSVAKKEAKKYIYDLLIIDAELEGDSAVDTILRFKEISPEVSIILITTVFDDNVRYLTNNGLVEGVLVAPYQSTHLCKKISEALILNL